MAGCADRRHVPLMVESSVTDRPVPLAQPERRRPGHRGRIGIIQPAPGVMLEYEWPAHLPDEVLFPMARIRMTGATAADYDRIAGQAPDYAQDLASAGADVIGYACSVGSLHAGVEAERRLVADLARASRKPVVSIADSSMRALARLTARRIAILTPYGEETNALVASYAGEAGFQVAALWPTPVGIVTVGDLSAAEIAGIAIDALRRTKDAEALWIPCTAIRTLDAIDAIEQATGRPVVSGSQSLLWGALRAIGIDDRLPRAGRLLSLSIS